MSSEITDGDSELKFGNFVSILQLSLYLLLPPCSLF